MHDLAIQLRELRSPPHQMAGLVGVADKYGRVTRAPRAHLGLHREARHFSLVFTSSATEKPRPLPRLYESLGLPAASQSMAAT